MFVLETVVGKRMEGCKRLAPFALVASFGSEEARAKRVGDGLANEVGGALLSLLAPDVLNYSVLDLSAREVNDECRAAA
jgi:hypothetical protein